MCALESPWLTNDSGYSRVLAAQSGSADELLPSRRTPAHGYFMTHANLLELRTARRTIGTLGFRGLGYGRLLRQHLVFHQVPRARVSIGYQQRQCDGSSPGE